MDERQVLNAFSALAQETHLRIVRLLVTAGPEGLPAGAVGEAVGASSSNLSFHLSLNHLQRHLPDALRTDPVPHSRLLSVSPGGLHTGCDGACSLLRA